MDTVGRAGLSLLITGKVANANVVGSIGKLSVEGIKGLGNSLEEIAQVHMVRQGALLGVVEESSVVRNTTNKGLRSSTLISTERAQDFLLKNGLSVDSAASYLASFDGPITARLVRPGEQFLRYTDLESSKGSFLTKTLFPDSTTAMEGLYLSPYGNRASYIQQVTSLKRSIVIEGNVAKGGVDVKQSFVINRDAFEFSKIRGK